MSKQLKKDFDQTVQSAARVALIAAVRRNMDSTLADVAKMAKDAGLGHLTVQEVFFDESITFETPKALLAQKRKKTKAKKQNAVPNMHSPKERARYDEKVLAAIPGGNWIRAEALGKTVGGTPLQRRKALNRLVAEGKIRKRGEARGAEYRLPKDKTKPKSKKKKKGKKGKKAASKKKAA